MRSMRYLLVGALLVALTTLAACGGNQASSAAATASQGGGASTVESTGGEPSKPPAATPTENGGNGGGDVDSVVSTLTPPNSNQLSRTDAGGGVVITWESTDSADSLKGFYESKIPGTGMQIVSTTSASGTFSWIFAKSEGSNQGGSVTVGPSSTGGSGSSVILTYTTQ